MSLSSTTKPPIWNPEAEATPAGWADPKTGELLATVGGLSARKGSVAHITHIGVEAGNKTFHAGDVCVLRVAFSENVDITSGTPTMVVALNGVNRTFTYFLDSADKTIINNTGVVANGTGTNILKFRYTMAETVAPGGFEFVSMTATLDDPLHVGGTVVKTYTGTIDGAIHSGR